MTLSIIDSYIKNPRKIHPSFTNLEKLVSTYRSKYFLDFFSDNYPNTKRDFLLNLPKEELWVTTLNDHCSPIEKNILGGRNGVWSIKIAKVITENRFHFSLGVYSACNKEGLGFYRYSPQIIQEDLIENFGEETYLKWKEQVKGDLPALQELITEVRKRIKKVIPSITCSPRSAKLCEKAGIPVKENIAFLLPMENS